MVDEVAKTVITVPMCLRGVGNQGFMFSPLYLFSILIILC